MYDLMSFMSVPTENRQTVNKTFISCVHNYADFTTQKKTQRRKCFLELLISVKLKMRKCVRASQDIRMRKIANKFSKNSIISIQVIC